MNAFVTAGAGFLLAVLWFDLMFDVQARAGASDTVSEPALASIATYYARVTTAAHPMNRLIAATMLATLAAIAVEVADGTGPSWLPPVSLALAIAPIGLAAVHTVPAAARLGTRRDALATQRVLARRVLAEHVFCFVSIACLITVQLGWG